MAKLSIVVSGGRQSRGGSLAGPALRNYVAPARARWQVASFPDSTSRMFGRWSLGTIV